ncbi:ABC transporter permease [Cellulomonas chitinilytica]|uniref:ABC transporter permease n=1 Tax=Cellulomonas chitinilytica TaxID=398759 RepID=A0A919TZ60_9CELL|nr:ABC transporter permease subunit [Cellulomonas chitinilytica]GIG21365.1 ABC transporter permease [Cellulomonas chitinilytica]
MTRTEPVGLDHPADPVDDAAPPPVGRAGTWGLTWHGVRTVAVLDLRQRVRSTRWIVALVVWFVVVGGITLLTTGALSEFGSADRSPNSGPILFAAVTALVLGLGLLVTPTLSSTAVNGDRNAGTLATLQVTLLTPAEIATGKLLAAWSAACAFLVTSLPFLVLALTMGGTPAQALVRVVLLVALLLLAVCGVGLGFSALVARTAGSTVLAFITVAAVTVLTPILFGLTYAATTTVEQVTVWGTQNGYGQVGSSDTCEVFTAERGLTHTERTWWLLGINPFVVVADGAGTAELAPGVEGNPLSVIRDGVRELRAGPAPMLDECWNGTSTPVEIRDDLRKDVSTAPVWPWGLGANLLLGVAGFVVAVRRLRIPQRNLARGTRVA